MPGVPVRPATSWCTFWKEHNGSVVCIVSTVFRACSNVTQLGTTVDIPGQGMQTSRARKAHRHTYQQPVPHQGPQLVCQCRQPPCLLLLLHCVTVSCALTVCRCAPALGCRAHLCSGGRGLALFPALSVCTLQRHQRYVMVDLDHEEDEEATRGLVGAHTSSGGHGTSRPIFKH